MKLALMPSWDITDKALLPIANNAIGSLTNNIYFPNPTPTLAEVQLACDKFANSMAKSYRGSLLDKKQKDADKLVLLKLTRQLVTFVNDEAQGDLVKLATCGFALSKDRQPIKLGTAQARVSRGQVSGQLILFTRAVHGALVYRYQYTTDPQAGQWMEVGSTRAKCRINNLVPGQIYYLRIVAVGTREQLTTSEQVSMMAA